MFDHFFSGDLFFMKRYVMKLHFSPNLTFFVMYCHKNECTIITSECTTVTSCIYRLPNIFMLTSDYQFCT